MSDKTAKSKSEVNAILGTLAKKLKKEEATKGTGIKERVRI